MDTIDRLTRAHQRLHATLNALDAAVSVGMDAWFAIRDLCFSTSRQLRNHIAREEQVREAAPWACDRVGVHVTRAIGHDNTQQRFQDLTWLVWGEPCVSVDGIRSSVMTAVAALRREMEEQDTVLFPWLKLSMSKGGDARQASAGWFHECEANLGGLRS